MSTDARSPAALARAHAGTSLRATLAARPIGARIADQGRAELVARISSESAAFARGLEEGRAEALANEAGALRAAEAELVRRSEQAALDLAHTAVTLATRIARELLRSEIDLGHYDLERIVREALAVSDVGRASCVVHVNPVDAERLKHVPFRAGLAIEADHEVARGDVHLTTPAGVLVRDIDGALEAIAEKIRGAIP